MTTNGTGGVELPIPNGWFAVAWSKDLVPGEVKRTRYFGQDLVMFRTRQGRVHVFDAYCAHLGAHLGEGGRVVGETLRCPFHGWQYEGSGKCVAIPYCQDVPSAARVRSWPVSEVNRMIFVWHHAGGREPSWRRLPARSSARIPTRTRSKRSWRRRSWPCASSAARSTRG